MPPGRPRDFDTDHALDAAMRLFWHRGYRATTTRDLVRALGLGQSSITSAFGTKADLADAALARYLAQLERELVGPLRDGADGLAAIDRFLAHLTDWHLAEGGRGCLVGRLMCEGAHAELRIAQRVGEYRVVLRRAIDAALERAVEAGEIRAEGLEERRNLVIAVVLALNLAMQAGYDADAQRALVRAGREQVASWSERSGVLGAAGR
jgi:TetR/AcrR family transcriptional repressor of nem operon